MFFFGPAQMQKNSPTAQQTRKWEKPKHKRACRGGYKIQKKKRIVGEGIYNISGVELTLDKGLKYAPKQNLNTFELYLDIYEKIKY